MASRLMPMLKLLKVSNRACSYKSGISLDKIYPGSSLKITTPDFEPYDPKEAFTGYIPINRLKITYSCSSGPGGQHVNKVQTKVDVRFKVTDADWLDAGIRERLVAENPNRITKDGELIFKSDVTRSQQLNLADCMRKMRILIRKASEPPAQISEETLDMLRRRREKANRDRLLVKRADAVKKSQKRSPTVHDL